MLYRINSFIYCSPFSGVVVVVVLSVHIVVVFNGFEVVVVGAFLQVVVGLRVVNFIVVSSVLGVVFVLGDFVVIGS